MQMNTNRRADVNLQLRDDMDVRSLSLAVFNRVNLEKKSNEA
jgi:hypothetical protein